MHIEENVRRFLSSASLDSESRADYFFVTHVLCEGLTLA